MLGSARTRVLTGQLRGDAGTFEASVVQTNNASIVLQGTGSRAVDVSGVLAPGSHTLRASAFLRGGTGSYDLTLTLR